MSRRPALRALANRAGILPHYYDTAARRVDTTDATREALLTALGLDATTEEAARQTLAVDDTERSHQLLTPCQVTATATESAPVTLQVTPRQPGPWEWSLAVISEDERTSRSEGQAVVGPDEPLTISTPPLRWGYYDLILAVRHETEGWEQRATQRHIVVPEQCRPPATSVGGRRAFGVHLNLYALRSTTNWGAGDLADVGRVADWVGRSGGDFVGLSPLHALLNSGADISPYRPVSRLFRNPLYLNIPAVTGFNESEDARRVCGDDVHERSLDIVQQGRQVDYEGVRKLQLRVLKVLHEHFLAHHARNDSGAGRAYRAFIGRHGPALHDFATYMAMRDHFSEADWRRWPDEYHDPRSAATDRFRRANAKLLDFHTWEQFELERQLAAAAERARAAGMKVGLLADLAIGSAPGGADQWSFPQLFVEDAELGAPPDDYSASGQNWAIPPLHPTRLRDGGYRYWTLLMRSVMQNAGAIRLDHVMGLFRQFWIPQGRPASEGAYIRFPAADLMGILSLESMRHGALVVGEDLGTVPEGFSEILERHNVLSTRVFYFQREPNGEFSTAGSYPQNAIVSATTHDNPPLAGFWDGTDLELRRRAGDIENDQSLTARQAARARDRAAIIRVLQAAGVLTGEPENRAALIAAIHRFLAGTPCVLASASLDDLAGEIEPVNLPGLGPERYRSWSRRMGRTLERLVESPDTAAALTALSEGRRR